MNIQEDVQALLQKEMDRKEFIKHIGIGFAAIIGITTVVKTINSMSGNNKKQLGYSGGAYGGDANSSAPTVKRG